MTTHHSGGRCLFVIPIIYKQFPIRLLFVLLTSLLYCCNARIPIIEKYIEFHNSNETARDDGSICTRQYVITQIHCKSSIGNEFMMLLNDLAIGIITNRTMLIHIDEDSCANKVVFAQWIPRFTTVISSLKSQCSMETYEDLTFILDEPDSASPLLLSCCHIDELHSKTPMVRYSRLDRMQASTLALEGANLLPAARSRAAELFSIPGKGALYGYGQIFQSIIKFAKTVQRWNERDLELLRQLRSNTTGHNVTILGAHLRHQQIEDQGKLQGFDATKTLQCLQSLLPATRQDNCVLILATDRARTLWEIEQWAQSRQIRCVFMHSASSHEKNPEDFGGGGKHDAAYNREEHGPWGDGLLVFTDMHLMAQSTVFVGSKSYSTFASSLSILFASIVAGKVGLARTQRFSPSCTPISFNGEIVNASAAQPVGDAAGSVKDAAKTGRELSGKSDKARSEPFLERKKGLYEKYVIDAPVLECSEDYIQGQCGTIVHGGRRLRSVNSFVQ